MTFLQDLFANIYILGFFSALLTFGLSIRMYPVIIYTVRTKNLMDESGERKIHASKIPTLGGVGLFAAFTLSLILFAMSAGLDQPDLIKLLSLLAATMILLFLGVKDELMAILSKKKFIVQIITSVIVIFLSDFVVISLTF